MNRYDLVTVTALVLIVLALPLYAWGEPERLAAVQALWQAESIAGASATYVEYCAACHGPDGQGTPAAPALDVEGLRTMDAESLYKVIARGRYDTAMAAWHLEEGGVLSDYEIDQLVTLIQDERWRDVRELAAAGGVFLPSSPLPAPDFAAQTLVGAETRDPALLGWQIYSQNCVICHGAEGEGRTLGVPLKTVEVSSRGSAELQAIIAAGVAGTAMPAWAGQLEPSAIEHLVSFLQQWNELDAEELALTPAAAVRVDLDDPEAVIDFGSQLYAQTCSACHGENGSGGTGPALNSLQILTAKTDEQIQQTILNGGHRPNSIMPAFADLLTSIEINALVRFIRAWEPTAAWVDNPRGTAQGGGPPWQRDGSTGPSGGGQGAGGRGGGPPWQREG